MQWCWCGVLTVMPHSHAVANRRPTDTCWTCSLMITAGAAGQGGGQPPVPPMQGVGVSRSLSISGWRMP